MKYKREKIITVCILTVEFCVGICLIGSCFAAGRRIAAQRRAQVSGSEAVADSEAVAGSEAVADSEAVQNPDAEAAEAEGVSAGAANIANALTVANALTAADTATAANSAAQEVFSRTVSGGDAQPETTGGTDSEADDEYANLAIANVDHYVNVRNAPNTDGEIVGKLYDGSVAQILAPAGENDEWLQVVSGNVEGYVKAEFFIYGDAAAAVIDDYVIRYVTVQADRLNVRQEPDIAAAKIGYVNRGESISLLEDCGEWLRVQYTEQNAGYVSAEYVTVTEEFIYAKSIEEERAELAAQRELAERARAMEEEAAGQETEANPAVGASDAEQAAGQDTATASGEGVGQDAADASGEGTALTGQTYTDNGELRAAIVAYAMQYLGNAYVHGGRSLDSGTDCSGFTCFIYADFGYSISRTPSGQLSSAGRSIDYSEIQPGDIICYTSNGGRSCTHVGLYIGDGQIIHAANSRKGVIISNADYSTIMGIKNVID